MNTHTAAEQVANKFREFLHWELFPYVSPEKQSKTLEFIKDLAAAPVSQPAEGEALRPASPVQENQRQRMQGEYRFDVSVMTDEKESDDDLVIEIMDSLLKGDRQIVVAPIPNPPSTPPETHPENNKGGNK